MYMCVFGSDITTCITTAVTFSSDMCVKFAVRL